MYVKQLTEADHEAVVVEEDGAPVNTSKSLRTIRSLSSFPLAVHPSSQLDVMERRVSTTNLDLATPNFAEHPQNQPLYHRTVYVNVPVLSTSLSNGVQTKHHEALSTIDHPTTVLNQSPQTSRANHCDNSDVHLTHRELPTRRARLDNGEQSQTSVDDQRTEKGYKVLLRCRKDPSNPRLKVIP